MTVTKTNTNSTTLIMCGDSLYGSKNTEACFHFRVKVIVNLILIMVTLFLFISLFLYIME